MAATKKAGGPKKWGVGTLLRGARVYLSGPMDFVASREEEKKYGWRTRVGEFLRELGVVVFDPWEKPQARGLYEYGREDVKSVDARKRWTFDDSGAGAIARAQCSGKFWETLHIDLRMVDTATLSSPTVRPTCTASGRRTRSSRRGSNASRCSS